MKYWSQMTLLDQILGNRVESYLPNLGKSVQSAGPLSIKTTVCRAEFKQTLER